jgi:KDO2-lipid IV(A) lauroyltransferase
MSETPVPAKLPLGLRLRYLAEAAGFFLLMGVMRLLGLDRASALGSFMGRRIFYPSGMTRRARENMSAAFPEKSAAEIETLLLEMWDNLGRVIAEYAHFDKFSIHGPDARLEFQGTENFEHAGIYEEGAMLISGHLANWEMMQIAITRFGLGGGVVYRPVNNPYVDSWVAKQRRKTGPLELIAKGPRGTRRVFTLLRNNRPVCLLVDQKTNEGIPAAFFGRDALTTPAPAVLALKMGKKLIPISNRRVGGSRFVVTAHPALSFTASGDYENDVMSLTQLITSKIEELIRANPAQWLWIHRRWPTSRDHMTSKRGIQSLAGNGVRAERDGSSLI